MSRSTASAFRHPRGSNRIPRAGDGRVSMAAKSSPALPSALAEGCSANGTPATTAGFYLYGPLSAGPVGLPVPAQVKNARPL
ncbi:hypothetical protein VTN96DRAFT_10093 [Rasamsonia emersonii]